MAWLSLVIGTYFRFIVYKYLFQQYKKKELTSVNKLSFTVVFIDHLSRTSGALATTLVILNGKGLDHVVGGYWFCTAQVLFGQFAFYYSFVGSLGVSIYRIILIKHNYFLKYVVGEKVMLSLILYGGILLTLIFTIILNSHDYDKLFDDTCMFVPKMQVLQILDEYEQSRGNLSIFSYYVKINISNGVVMAFMTISELMIYIIFFHHMYKHDNNDRLRRILEPRVIKGRNRKNAITFIGQFCSFVFEFTGLLLLILAFTVGPKWAPDVAIDFRRLSFVIISMVEVLTSDVLRKKLFKINLYNIIFGLN